LKPIWFYWELCSQKGERETARFSSIRAARRVHAGKGRTEEVGNEKRSGDVKTRAEIDREINGPVLSERSAQSHRDSSTVPFQFFLALPTIKNGIQMGR
jgi:hypothetical protein